MWFGKRLVYSVVATVICLMGQGSLALSEGKSYAYLAKGVPANSKSCHDQAQELAQRFTQLTGLASSGRCESISKKGIDILIRYQAEEPLSVVSSATEIGFPGQGYEFSTKDQCEKELDAEIESFKSLTGTAPLLSFCRGQENYYGLVRWALIVEGFGKEEKKYSWASSLFPGTPTRELVQRIKSEVKKEFSNALTTVRHVFLQQDEHGHLRLTVNYHGKYGEQLKAFSLAAVNSLNQCQEALNVIEEINNANSDIKTLGYCVNNPYRRGADLVVIIDVTRWYRVRQSAESFQSYEECEGAKPALLEVYESHYPEKLLGGLCTEWGSHWKLNLIER